MHDLRAIQLDYFDCLNARNWDRSAELVADDVTHDGRPVGVAGQSCGRAA